MAIKGCVEIDREKCKACYLCVHVCPAKIIEKDTSANAQGVFPVKVSAEGCSACGNCYTVCPDICVTIWQL